MDSVKANRAVGSSLALGVLSVLAIPFLFKGSLRPALHELLWANAALFLAFVYLWIRKKRHHQSWTFKVHIRARHFVHSLVQLSVYVALFRNSPHLIGSYMPFIVYQLGFATIFEFLFSVAAGTEFRLGSSIAPIVLSINLLFWFLPAYFYLALFLVIIALLSRRYLAWTIDGKRKHIFNPSGFALAVAALPLIVFPWLPVSAPHQLVGAYFRASPEIFIVVFLGSCITLTVADVVCVSFGALAMFALVQALSFFFFGMPALPKLVTPIEFIGLTYLVTDPATSPKNRLAQVLYGGLYAVSVMAAFAVLAHFYRTTIYDKVLFLPLVNLLAPMVENFGRRSWAFSLSGFSLVRRLTPIALYTLLFVSVMPQLPGDHRHVFLREGLGAGPVPRIRLYRHRIFTHSRTR